MRFRNSLCATLVAAGIALSGIARAADAPQPAGVFIEAEDFKSQSADGWKVVQNDHGNYMTDIIGFNHISGERLLSAEAHLKDARAVATVNIPEVGDYRLWTRFEQPTGTENRFRVEVRQNGQAVGSAVMGEKDAPKYFFGSKKPVGQYDASWGSEGLVEQGFDIKGLQAGPAELTLIALDQPELAANRNVDFVWLTRDLQDSWRDNPRYADLYRILDAVMPDMPTRYYMRLTSPIDTTLNAQFIYNRGPWYPAADTYKVQANTPSEWIPLRKQDVCHFTTLSISDPSKQNLKLRVELASTPNEASLVRAIDWDDPKSNAFSVGLPPYPNKYKGEQVITVEEQYRNIADYLKAHPTKVGRIPTLAIAQGGYIQVWDRGRVGDAAAELYNEIGMREYVGFVQPKEDVKARIAVANERFKQWGVAPTKSVSVGAYRLPPTPENVAAAYHEVLDNGLLPLTQRYDYGDEIAFQEWLGDIKPEELKTRFVAWQQQHLGKVRFETPDSSAKAAVENPELYVNSQRFYEETAIDHVAEQAAQIPKTFSPTILYGANVAAHPFYYPEIAKYIKWFRATPQGTYAANFGRHSEYFWQVGQPGPLINGYVADHFRSGMRYNPLAVNQQYTMPHSPGNSGASFRRSAFTHLAHGARGLDYFGIGANSTFTENYIDFRDYDRYAAIREINRKMALVEDIIPQSKVVPNKVALILSDSTERWDFAPIAMDKAAMNVFGEGYQKMRLAYHMDRLGIYYALVHHSHPPDLVTEEDVQAGVLKDYQAAYWVGDCIEPATLRALSDWINGGGHLVATATSLRYDQYHRPINEGLNLLGLQSADTKVQSYFFRPQIELPRLEPVDYVRTMPVVGLQDRVAASAGARVAGSFKSGSPAVVESTHGKGSVTYIAALPGAAYLWSAYQPAPVPSRGPSSHMPLITFNTDAARWLLGPLQTVATNVDAHGAWIDANLLKAPKGYAVPIANYSPNVDEPVTLTIRNAGNVRSVTSAAAGKLKTELGKGGSVTVRYVPGLIDMLRIDN